MVLQIFAVPSVLMIIVDFVFQDDEPVPFVLKGPTDHNDAVLPNRPSTFGHFFFDESK